ncbi:hypothetical protein D3C81_2031800 [compost metagenome]
MAVFTVRSHVDGVGMRSGRCGRRIRNNPCGQVVTGTQYFTGAHYADDLALFDLMGVLALYRRTGRVVMATGGG